MLKEKSIVLNWCCTEAFFQPALNILGIFAECSHSAAMFRASRKHLGNILKENIFKKILNGKVNFMLKVYDLLICWQIPVITKQCFQNIFEEHSTNLCFQNIPKISPEYCKVTEIFLWSHEIKILFCEWSCENVNVGSLLL